MSNEMIDKPWGYYVDLEENKNQRWKVKRLVLLPNQRFSLQRHALRSETWVLVSGSVTVTLDGLDAELPFRGRVHIKAGRWHRATAGDHGATLIEVQMGDCDEDDIERAEDDYGRF